MNRFSQELGNGPFGRLYRGDLLNVYSGGTIGAAPSGGGSGGASGSVDVAVFIKCLRPGASAKLQADFQREAQLMSLLQHANLLNLVGVCIQDHPWSMLYEYVPYGDLKEFLVLNAPNRSDTLSLTATGTDEENTTNYNYNNYNPNTTSNSHRKTLLPQDQLHIAIQISAGMQYLASRNFVHRDLAARSILIGQNLTCKISDFGICCEKYADDYYLAGAKPANGAGQGTPQGGSLLPVRWMAPESLSYHSVFTLETDVWSFGVLLWEIFAYGQQPYSGYGNEEVIEMIRKKQLLNCTEDCPMRIYALMNECWQEISQQRPHFRDIHARLEICKMELDPQTFRTGGMSRGLFGTKDSSTVQSPDVSPDSPFPGPFPG